LGSIWSLAAPKRLLAAKRFPGQECLNDRLDRETGVSVALVAAGVADD
jgi:hypothetical protein